MYHGRLKHLVVLESEVIQVGVNYINSLGTTVELVLMIGEEID